MILDMLWLQVMEVIITMYLKDFSYIACLILQLWNKIFSRAKYSAFHLPY